MAFKRFKRADASARIEQLNKQAEKSTGSQYSDTNENYWQPTPDKAGAGSALIRFLPAPDGEACDWISYWDHGFKGPTGKWYIERSLTSINKEDPLGEYNSRVWNDSTRDKKEREEEVRGRKRRQHFVSNILVINDPANPDNNGKVFMYRYGLKIFEKIEAMLDPKADEFSTEDPVPVDIFNPFDGANFKLRFQKVGGFRNYDRSEFDNPSDISEQFDLEEIESNLHSLEAEMSEENFKTYDVLKKKLMEVLNLRTLEVQDMETETVARAPSPGPSVEMNITADSDDDDASDSSDDDDYLSKFQKMAG